MTPYVFLFCNQGEFMGKKENTGYVDNTRNTRHSKPFEEPLTVEFVDNYDTLYKIQRAIERDPLNFRAYQDMFYLLSTDLDVERGIWLSDKIREVMPRLEGDGVYDFYELHKRVLLLVAPYDFDSYLIYVEWERMPKLKFYEPRREQLYEVAQALQDLHDDKLDILGISMPPGTGKSTIAIFFLSWLAGKYPQDPNLTGSHSAAIIRGMYEELLRITDPNGDYLWNDVFPLSPVVKTNAKDLRIDMDKPKRFQTLQFTSIGTGNAGLFRASRLLYCDDLVSGLEVALSKERLDKLWATYTTDLRQRKIGDHCKELHIATRWSVHDVIGRLERKYRDSDRAKFIVLPAMDKNDESNFDYKFGVGFSTEFYRGQRDIMPELDWKALYMNEPIEREGLLYNKDELRRFFDLPDRKPDAVIAVCDTKDKGKDYASLPVAYVYGNDYYIADVLFNDGMPEVLDDMMVDILVRNNVNTAQFESNSAGGRVAKDVNLGIKARGGNTKVVTKFTTSNKETKIIVHSGWVKEHCLFLDDSRYKINSEYHKFIDFLTSYTVKGKNAHDDAPDSIAMLSEYAQSLTMSRPEITDRFM